MANVPMLDARPIAPQRAPAVQPGVPAYLMPSEAPAQDPQDMIAQYLNRPQVSEESPLDASTFEKLKARYAAIDPNFMQNGRDIQEQAKAIASAPTQYDLSPLLSIADNAFGSKTHYAKDYKAPESAADRSAMIAKLQSLAGDSSQKDISNLTQFIKGELTNKTRTGYQKLGPSAMIAPGQKAEDLDFAKDYENWNVGGKASAEKALEQLKSAREDLEKNPNLVGPSVGNVSDKILSVVNPKAIDTRQKVQTGTLQGLKSALGGKFSKDMADMALSHAYNPSLSAKDNIERIKATEKQINQNKDIMESRASHFRAHKTLSGWQPQNQAAEQKPKTVIQDGHTFTLNEATGEYE